MRIVDAHWSGRRLILRADIWMGEAHHSAWKLRFSGVVEQSLSVVVECGLNIWREHPVLDQHMRRREFLHFGRSPDNLDEVIGQLWRAHVGVVDDWIPFDRYLNHEVPLAELLASGSGLLATGPDFLIAAYEGVMERVGCRPSRLPLPTPPRLTHGLVAHFGESYVVAEQFTAQRIAV
jgi:hypothetical protein